LCYRAVYRATHEETALRQGSIASIDAGLSKASCAGLEENRRIQDYSDYVIIGLKSVASLDFGVFRDSR